MDAAIIAYVGPETFGLLASVLAAVGGAFLMFGGYFMKLAKGFLRMIMRK